ncbi:UDP-N-acetylglucosamine--N-acetylmuramyl-(pentapeptide) pyrophosphoryl-undecaprenol N-acetylglucosamine transferase MurG [Planctomycetes bacterium MalM25]|nr:UDP-N-acetylglucosamine--N-acetylmuramyl-(pentapeptide) pyrophosphoryl-undecaprenol N-acetylglucosamine transferase MurG [Planctomycetes bacterium MalM25]
MSNEPHVLIAGGGSLGNVYPGLSIARRFLQRVPNAKITLAGDGRAIERHTVSAFGLAYATIPRADSPQGVLSAPGYVASNAAGWCVSHWLLREQEIDLVISLGGHAAGPVVRAARASGVPYVIIEQNCLPTPATLAATRDARLVCVAHEESAPRLPMGAPVLYTGGVGRPGFEDAFGDGSSGWRQPEPNEAGRPRLVVLGGVGGATSLNASMPQAASRLGEALSGWQIVHQTGDGWLTETERRYQEAGVEAVAVTYIDELAHLARETDLVVCRPSGSALAELSLAGIPAALVPDSRRRDALHQENARLAELRYGCPVVQESEGDFSKRLAEQLAPLLIDSASRQRIAERLAKNSQPHAASVIAEACCSVLGVAAPGGQGLRRAA